MKILIFVSLFVVLGFAGIARSQLVLDDVADEFEPEQIQSGSAGREPTDPYTKMLQWGVDNMDRASIAEQAQAIREV